MSLIFSHNKSSLRWSISVFYDYENVVSQFIQAEGWDFETFKGILKACGTPLLHHCAVGKGKPMDDQRLNITKALLETARDFWLYFPLNEFLRNINTTANDDNFCVPDSEPLHRVKQMLAGFYLTFTMYNSQTYFTDKVKVSMDLQDMVAFNYFRIRVLQCTEIPEDLKMHIMYQLLSLIGDDAFSLCSESSQCGLSIRTRLRQGAIISKQFGFIGDLRQNLLSLALPQVPSDVKNQMAIFEANKAGIVTKALCGSTSADIRMQSNMICGGSEASEVSLVSSASASCPDEIHGQLVLACETGVQDVLNAAVTCKVAVEGPIFTIRNISGNNFLNHIILQEAARRMALQLKSLPQQITNNLNGLDSSDEEIGENTEKVRRKVKSIPENSQNLMRYIRDLPYADIRVKNTDSHSN